MKANNLSKVMALMGKLQEHKAAKTAIETDKYVALTFSQNGKRLEFAISDATKANLLRSMGIALIDELIASEEAQLRQLGVEV